MNKTFLFMALLLAALTSPMLVEAQEIPMCVTDEWCLSLPEDTCAAFPESVWYTDPAIYGLLCEIVCCELPDEATYSWTLKSTCIDTDLIGGTEVEGAACGEQPAQCAEGQSNCLCGSVQIESGYYCCSGQVSPYACEEEETPVAGTTCGNGVVEEDKGEKCEEGQVSRCATGLTNSCTATCQCLYDEDDYDAEDDFCSPLDDCSQGTTCLETAPAPTCEDGAPCVQAVLASPNATIDWSFDSENCLESLEGFVVDIVREDAPNMGPPRITIDDNETRNTTFAVEPETHYRIRVGAVYESGVTAWSKNVTWQSGVVDCFTERRAYCEGPQDKVTCDSNNRPISPMENCHTSVDKGVCMPTEQGAVCVPEVPCDACDASYESMAEYGFPGLYVTVQLDEPEDFACHELSQPLNRQGQTITFCNYAYTYSALKEYESCSSIGKCSDYKDPASCGEPDPCNVMGTCEWNPTNKVCNAEEEEYRGCEEEWDEDTCQAYGCVYARNRCLDHDQVSCRDYTDREQCTNNGANFNLDPDTNAYAPESDDTYGFGKCKWIPALGPSGSCIKDADDDYGTPGGELETDSDFTNPVTSLLIDSDEPFGKEITIPFRVSEESTTYAELKTGTCGVITRPTTTTGIDQENGVMRFTRTEKNDYCLLYYSKDRQNNMEFVNSKDIKVDPTQLRIINVTQQVTPNVLTNLSSVYITWRSTREAACYGGLTGPSGNIRAETSGYADAFDLRIKDLEDGAYTFDIECSTPRGLKANHTEHVVLDIDSRITRPIPAQGTYRSAPLVGIHTSNTSTCEYESPSGWKPLTQRNNIVQINNKPYRLHTALFTATESKLYEMGVRCTFEDGVTVIGGDADKILFAIDKQPPSTAVHYTFQGSTLNSTGGGIPVVPPRALVNISCADPKITGRGRDWQAGCDVIRFVVDGAETNSTVNDGLVTGFAITPDMQVRIGGRDKLGNDEQLSLYMGVDEDISGPERPEFSIP